MSNIKNFKTVNVTSLNAFPDPTGINNKEIVLEDGINYRWTKPLTAAETQDFRFVFPDASKISLSTSSAVSNSLTTGISGDAPLFSGTPDRVIIDNLDIFASGGKWVDLTGSATAFPNLFMTGSRIQGFDSLGSMDSMGYLSENVSYFFNGEGLTMNDMLLVALDEQNFAGQVGDHLIFTGTLAFATLRSVLGNPLPGDSLFNFASDLITGGIQIPLGAFNPTGGGTYFAPGGLNETSPSIRVTGVLNTIESNAIGSIGFKENTIPTAFATVNTHTPILGTIVLSSTSERFQLVGKKVQYIGFDPIKAIAEVSLAIRRASPASSSRTVRVTIFLNSIEQESMEIDVVGHVSSISFQDDLSLVFGDIIEIQIKNKDTIDDIVIVDYNLTVNVA